MAAPNCGPVAEGVRDFRAIVGRVWTIRSTSQTNGRRSPRTIVLRAVIWRAAEWAHRSHDGPKRDRRVFAGSPRTRQDQWRWIGLQARCRKS